MQNEQSKYRFSIWKKYDTFLSTIVACQLFLYLFIKTTATTRWWSTKLINQKTSSISVFIDYLVVVFLYLTNDNSIDHHLCLLDQQPDWTSNRTDNCFFFFQWKKLLFFLSSIFYTIVFCRLSIKHINGYCYRTKRRKNAFVQSILGFINFVVVVIVVMR